MKVPLQRVVVLIPPRRSELVAMAVIVLHWLTQVLLHTNEQM